MGMHSTGAGSSVKSPKDSESKTGVPKPVSETLPAGASKTGVKKE